MNTYYAYTKKITLQPNQRIDQELQLQADSDFIIERVYAIFNKPFKIQILDTTSNYNWFSNRIRSDAWFGFSSLLIGIATPTAISSNKVCHGALFQFPSYRDRNSYIFIYASCYIT